MLTNKKSVTTVRAVNNAASITTGTLNMKLHRLPIRTLPARLSRGMLVAAQKATMLMVSGDVPKNRADAPEQAGQEWYGSAALAGCGGM